MKIKNETSAGGIVYKKEGSTLLWLIGQHSAHKGWVFLKGLVGDKIQTESMESAAVREVEEEGGVKAKIIEKNPIKVQYSYEWNNTKIHKTVYYFLMEYISGNTNNHDWEMSDVKFVTEKDIINTLTYPSDKEAFAKLKKIT